tara:strand:+ start:186 stop:596 length:411 start_codon:yes stop_codon:yes gene_type:complete
MDTSKIPTPDAFALQLTELMMPFIGMLMIIIIAFMIKDFATKLSKGIAFSMNKQFQEGDQVILDGEPALIVKIGMTQTVFGINRSCGDYIWRYVPNERMAFIKLEKIVFSRKPDDNEQRIDAHAGEIKELKGKKNG